MKNIVCLIGQLGNGGSERQLALFLKKLDREKYNPVVIVTSVSGGRWEDHIKNELSVPVHSLGDKRHIFKILKYRSILSELKPSIVLCWSFFANPLYLFSWGTRFIGALRNGLDVPKKEFSGFHFKLAMKPKRFVVNSSLLARQLADAGIAENKVSVIYNFFEMNKDFEDKGKRLEAKRQKRAEYNIPEDAILVVWAARDNPVKGFPFFVDVFEKTLESVPNLRGFLGGSGSLSVKDEIAKRGLQDKITIAGDIKNIRLMLPIADIFFLPSLAEGMPNIFLEAIDAGCGVLATDVGGIRDIYSVLDEETRRKLLIEQRDVEEASGKLKNLCVDAEFRSGATEKLKRKLYEMSPTRIMDKFYNLFPR